MYAKWTYHFLHWMKLSVHLISLYFRLIWTNLRIILSDRSANELAETVFHTFECQTSSLFCVILSPTDSQAQTFRAKWRERRLQWRTSLVSASHNSINIPATGLNMTILCRHIHCPLPVCKATRQEMCLIFLRCRRRSFLSSCFSVFVLFLFTMNRVRAVVQVAHFNSMYLCMYINLFAWDATCAYFTIRMLALLFSSSFVALSHLNQFIQISSHWPWFVSICFYLWRF